MFNSPLKSQRKPDPLEPANTLLGPGASFRGEIDCGSTSVRIEGTFEGTITSTGQVAVVGQGLVTGTIIARELVVAGRVEGVFKVEGCLMIRETGWVEGEVEVGTMVVDEGGTFQGTCHRRGQKDAAPSAQVIPIVPKAANGPIGSTVDFKGSRGFEARKP
ncbi:MAG TPA: polymer-forming cytoskeletal protein [Holophagaceae bacterium]|nr:polymer-forming cytoskeletal protein [Holophagaceae bacterium]